ncbi:murein DD-endopeptidase MepM/ murein hydrolase activator NlpD [Sphingomonas jejuensis]|uniref:Murein DD-endopeptidase MepM/ murein hydrolase activator NlpD n=1 Tax=Sphingomonas jejuensis TaxID=904715 RepID=A0ABX0XJX9_9SPHN|nr:M23 family metallopeptidase [Sphingomonas jejuensis]NJC33172.1 murein DD-endopeptidase MepM/ murein hydrolase activator NlpD [Sphingomonas jejuensis]
MNRLGWLVLSAFLLVGGCFWLLQGEGSPIAQRQPSMIPPYGGTALIIPVAGVSSAALVDTWGQSRAGGARSHDAIDIMAPRGTAVLAARAGRVEKLFQSGDGGLTAYLRSSDGRWVDYYAHLDRYRPGLAEGQTVPQGAAIGTVGSTGNASPDGPHLHFSVKRMGAGESWHEGEAINPFPLLAGRRGPG